MKNAQKYHLNPIEKFLIRVWRYFLSTQHYIVLMIPHGHFPSFRLSQNKA